MDFFAKLMGKNPKKYKVFFCVITHTHTFLRYIVLCSIAIKSPSCSCACVKLAPKKMNDYHPSFIEKCNKF